MGRGYTQDTLTRLLIDASENEELLNPFYYIRNFTSDIGNSIRHRFSSRPANFSYFETIFAQTPYQSVPGYLYGKDNIVEPIIIPQENDFTESISEGIKLFALTYSELATEFTDGFNRYLAEASYNYQFSNPNDAYITGVFAKFKDNLGMYGTPVEFAPEITEETLKQIAINDVVKETRNIEMSLARSTKKVRDKVNKALGINCSGVSRQFIINDLERYVKLNNFPQLVVSKKVQAIFASVDWAKHSQVDRRISQNEIIEVLGIEWTKTGVPRLRIAEGYITAHKDFIKTFDEVDKIYSVVEQKVYKDYHLSEVVGSLNSDEITDMHSYRSINNCYVLLTAKGYINVKKDNIKLVCAERQEPFEAPVKLNHLSFKKIAEIENTKGKNIYVLNDCIWLSKPQKSLDVIIINAKSTGIHRVEDVIQSPEGIYYLKIKNKYILAESCCYGVVRDDIDNFSTEIETEYYKLKHTLNIYSSSDFKENNKTGMRYRKYSLVKGQEIIWTRGGTPRIKTDKGYISANWDNLSKVDNNNIFTKVKYTLSKFL